MTVPELVAEGSGYYRVYVDGTEVSQHTTERKAVKRAMSEREANPTADVTYDHDYLVVVGNKQEEQVDDGTDDGSGDDSGGSDDGTDSGYAFEAEQPRVTVTEPLIPEVTRTVRVTNHTELNDAFNELQDGDEIVLAKGVNWGQVNLPSRSGSRVTLRGEGDVPPVGQRISPSDDVTEITYDLNGGMIRAEDTENWYVYGLRGKTEGDITDGLVAQNASGIVFDRVHAWAPGDANDLVIRRGARLNGSDVSLINSRIEGIIRDGQQSQGVGIWDGSGPFLIENNFIEALNQNILVGGAKPSSLDNNPSDGVIRHNHFYTRPSWRDIIGTIMVFEWKAGERWLAEENVVENDFQGFTVAVKAPSETQGLEGQRTGDLTLRRNKYIGEFTGVGAYMLFRTASTAHREDASRFVLEDELWAVHSGGRSIRLGHAPDGTIIRRVTCNGTHSSMEILKEAPTGESPRLVVESYRGRSGKYGLWLTDDDFPDGFKSAYPDHIIEDYWQYRELEDTSHKHHKIPETLSEEAQTGFHDIELAANIPDHVGADEVVVNDATTGVRDPDRPQ